MYDEIRVSSFFGKELILGSYLSRLFPLFFALFIARVNKHPLEIYFFSFLYILVDILIFLSGERASFFFLNLSTVFIMLFISKYKLLRIGLFILSLIIIIFLTLNDSKLHQRYVVSPLTSMGLKNENENKKLYLFTPVHDSLIKTAYNMFLDKPILGHGPKLFRIKCHDPKYAVGDTPCDQHPHNFYFQLLAETGIIGFSFLLGLFLYVIYLSIKHIIQYLKYKKYFLSDYQICLLGGLLITTWPFTSNGSIFTNYLMLFYSLQIGFFKKKINLN
jgi:O-antigen ligase